MKRLLILVAVVALAMYVTSRPVLAAAQHHGGHHGGHSGHRGGHSGHHIGHSSRHIGHSSHHIGHSVHRGSHVGHHTGHHGSSLHLSFGSGRHYSSYYGYRSPYSYSYSSPAYRSYSYPTYRRTYRYVNPSCYGPSVILIPPTQPKAEAAEEDEQPEVDPAPEPVPALEPAPAAAPSAGTSPLAPGTIRYAVLRSQQPLPERATARQPAQLAPNRIAGATPQPSSAGSLGPRLAAPKVRSLISDDDVPWVAP